MTTIELRRMTHETPFVAFSVNMADGRSIRVTHPEQVANYPDTDRILIALPAYDFAIVDLALVTSLTTAPAG